MSAAINPLNEVASNSITTIEPYTGELAEALAKALGEFKTVQKSKVAKVKSKTTGAEFSYKYADLDDVLSMIRPVLSKHGISFSQPLLRREGKLYVTTRLQFGNQTLQDGGIYINEDVEPQIFGTRLSYYRRYGASSFLGISTDEDVDATPVEVTSEKKKPGRPPKQTLADVTTNVVNQEPESNTTPVQTSKPESSELTEEDLTNFGKKIRNYGVDLRTVGAFVRRSYDVPNTRQLNREQWLDVFDKFDAAQAENGVDGINQLIKAPEVA
jgi:hypothetical protein